MANFKPKPVTLTQVAAEDYADNFKPEPLLVVGDVPSTQFTQGAAQADSVATTVAGLVTDFNALLAKLRAAGIIASS